MRHTTKLYGILLISLLIILITSQAGLVSAGINVWTSIGPEGGYISALVIDPVNPSIVYAGIRSGGVFKSVNGGEDWSVISTELVSVETLVIDPTTPSTLYAGINGGRVYKSTDSGVSWILVSSGIITSCVYALVIDPTTPSNLYAATANGMFRSTNGGENWEAINNGLTPSYVESLVIDPINPSTLYVSRVNGGVYKSTDSGGNWNPVNNGLLNTLYRLAIDPVTPTTLYAGSYGMLKSIDGGEHWTEINLGLPYYPSIATIFISPTAPNTIYVGIAEGVLKSTNGGDSWESVNTGLNNNSVITIAINPIIPDTIIAGTAGGGVYKSINGGGAWSTINSGLNNTDVRTLAIDPTMASTIYACTWGGIFKSMNNGGTWSVVNNGLSNLYIDAFAIDTVTPSTLYAGTSGGGVFKSINGGDVWEAIGSGYFVQALAINPVTPSTLYAGTSDGVYKSTNSGSTWSVVNDGLTNTDVRSVAINPAVTSTLYAGTAGGGVFKSMNSGGTWNAVNNGLTYANTYIRALAVDPATPSTLYAATVGYSVGNIYKSTNSGEEWTSIDSGRPNYGVETILIDPDTTSTLYIGTSGGVFKSINGGASWSALNNGLANKNIHTLTIGPTTPNTIYAGTWGGGVYEISFSGEEPTYSISGYVADGIGNWMSGVTISGGAGHSTTTDSNGHYILSSLQAGTYSVTPYYPGYTFSPASRMVIVPPDTQGQDFTGAVLSISHIEVTQGIQDIDNSVPLIAGKPTIVRAYLQSDSVPITDIDGTLYMSNNGGSTWVSVQAENAPATAVPSGEFDREKDLYALRFTLPKSMWHGTVLVYAEAYTNPVGTRTQSVQETLSFIPVDPISIGYVSIPYKGVSPDLARISKAQSYLNSIYPLQVVNYFPVTQAIEYHGDYTVSSILKYLDDIYTWYKLFGWSIPTEKFDKLFGWLPDSTWGFNGAAVMDGNSALGSDTQKENNRVYQVILAHEVGHLYGLIHPCDGNGNGNRAIGDVGFDFGFYYVNMLVSATTDEMMVGNHCERDGSQEMWISANNFNLLYKKFTYNIPWRIAQLNRPLQNPTGEPVLLVSGTVNNDGTVNLDPAYQILPLQPYTQTVGTDYCLTLEDEIGIGLTSDCFNLSFVDPEGGTPMKTASFVRLLPYDPLAARLVLSQAGQQLAEIVVSANAPTVNLLWPNGGEILSGTVDVSWTAGDIDGDPLTFAFFYSVDDGQSWYHLGSGITDTHLLVDTEILPGSDHALFRIIATDGINTTTDESDDPFIVDRKAPHTFILSPEREITIPISTSLSLQGYAYDLEDGQLADAAFQWYSDKDGFLGIGQQCMADLSFGDHHITLTAIDSDGNTATDTIHVFVGNRVFLPLSLKN